MKKIIITIISLFLVVGCSQQPTTNKEMNNRNTVNEKLTPATAPKAPTTFKEVLKRGPGKYGGSKYDKAKVQAELDKLPPNLPPEKVYNYLVALLAEDYNPVIEKMNQLDTSFKGPTAGPRGDIKNPDLKLNKKINIEVLLDSSGSMAEQIGGKTKMDLAKEAINQFVASMPQGASVALRVYGHKGSNQNKDKAISCNSSEVVYPLGAYDNQKFQSSLNKFTPTGWTPLALAIRSAQQDLSAQSNAENIIYIVSDGVETCGGNPVQEAQQLHNSNVKAVVNIIGFDVDNAGQKALQQVAQSGGGTYYTVNNQEDLKAYFNQQYDELSKKWGEWLSKDTDNVLKESTNKLDTLGKLLDLGTSTLNTETQHIIDAKNYLSEKGKIDGMLLYSYITDRQNMIQNFITQKYEQLLDELNSNSTNRLKEGTKVYEDAKNKINQQSNQ
ncbi:VWA domain-containing protein [Polycladomyces sp. WAk]|uniref:VWA domain-containing protein n=1 Tax=Polycladomyces zharkentensis TaxID=2807616 RepID=A0ABS2WMB1_9BACL|nr:VWA domain-containing protein [Polycladomyces sp. WAk]MBN2910613.1 VWA domain-containing protein [Polycladomyces sp. WAk]